MRTTMELATLVGLLLFVVAALARYEIFHIAL
jgi:hypothetical protein